MSGCLPEGAELGAEDGRPPRRAADAVAESEDRHRFERGGVITQRGGCAKHAQKVTGGGG